MKGIIIYKGKYGATEQYVSWLAEQLQLPSIPADDFSSSRILMSDFVVIASSVYIGKWILRDWLKQHFGFLKNKKIFLLVVCGTPSSEKEKQEEIARNNFSGEVLSESEVFFLPGRLTISKLSWKDRLMLRIGSMLEKDPKSKKAMQRDIDGVRKELLTPVINRIIAYVSKDTKPNEVLYSIIGTGMVETNKH
jgi:menaquinone-dependent protoporphyrinogen IX oxidase